MKLREGSAVAGSKFEMLMRKFSVTDYASFAETLFSSREANL